MVSEPAAVHGGATREAIAPDDILVFERSDAGFSLVGGSGRGAGWAGLVDLGLERSLVSRAWDSGAPVRQSGPQASHVAGPYHAKHAVAVAIGDRHVVILGANHPLDLRDAGVIRIAAAAVDRAGGIPAEKVLADELELVHAVKALMAYRPETVRGTLEHIASVAANALSCEVAYAAIGTASGARVSIGFDAEAEAGPSAIDRRLEAAMERGLPIVDQASSEGSELFGLDVASTMTLPIGADPAIGALVLAHAAERPRGFTSLCQRIGRAVAESAELLISQADAR
jgi:hypothetical protein